MAKLLPPEKAKKPESLFAKSLSLAKSSPSKAGLMVLFDVLFYENPAKQQICHILHNFLCHSCPCPSNINCTDNGNLLLPVDLQAREDQNFAKRN